MFSDTLAVDAAVAVTKDRVTVKGVSHHLYTPPLSINVIVEKYDGPTLA